LARICLIVAIVILSAERSQFGADAKQFSHR
jgi:hypothetical protein